MWWVQAALLGAVSMAYRLTRDVLYVDWLQRQILFIKEKQRDPSLGAWHMLLHADGTIYHGQKGHGSIEVLPIKAGYHAIQSLFHTAANLEKTDSVQSNFKEGVCWDDLAF
jgi:mannose/cellobiose epimerase-like protein (N-acyl-D-glucosamine 2-epimerase family)